MNLRKDHYRNFFHSPNEKNEVLTSYQRIKSPWRGRAAFSAKGGADDCPGALTWTGLRVKERNTRVRLSGVTAVGIPS